MPENPSPKAAPRDPVITLRDARLALSSAEGMVEILRGITLNIEAGETVGVLGPSGAGKTSLLMVMAGLEGLSDGSIDLAGREITGMGEDALAALRRDNVGIIFQAFRLIPSMTALQNVAVPMEIYEMIRELAKMEDRTIARQLAVLIKTAHQGVLHDR